MGALCLYRQVIRGANSKPLPIAGQTRYLRLKWGSATGHSSFVVIMGLAGRPTPVPIGMDLMVPLQVQIDATSCNAIPQFMHTLQEQEDPTSTAISAMSPLKRHHRPLPPPPPWTLLGQRWQCCCRGCRSQPNLSTLYKWQTFGRTTPSASSCPCGCFRLLLWQVDLRNLLL